jgi:hypothetical protein
MFSSLLSLSVKAQEKSENSTKHYCFYQCLF